MWRLRWMDRNCLCWTVPPPQAMHDISECLGRDSFDIIRSSLLIQRDVCRAQRCGLNCMHSTVFVAGRLIWMASASWRSNGSGGCIGASPRPVFLSSEARRGEHHPGEFPCCAIGSFWRSACVWHGRRTIVRPHPFSRHVVLPMACCPDRPEAAQGQASRFYFTF